MLSPQVYNAQCPTLILHLRSPGGEAATEEPGVRSMYWMEEKHLLD